MLKKKKGQNAVAKPTAPHPEKVPSKRQRLGCIIESSEESDSKALPNRRAPGTTFKVALLPSPNIHPVTPSLKTKVNENATTIGPSLFSPLDPRAVELPSLSPLLFSPPVSLNSMSCNKLFSLQILTIPTDFLDYSFSATMKPNSVDSLEHQIDLLESQAELPECQLNLLAHQTELSESPPQGRATSTASQSLVVYIVGHQLL